MKSCILVIAASVFSFSVLAQQGWNYKKYYDDEYRLYHGTKFVAKIYNKNGWQVLCDGDSKPVVSASSTVENAVQSAIRVCGRKFGLLDYDI